MHITNNAIKFIRQRTLRKKQIFFPFSVETLIIEDLSMEYTDTMSVEYYL